MSKNKAQGRAVQDRERNLTAAHSVRLWWLERGRIMQEDLQSPKRAQAVILRMDWISCEWSKETNSCLLCSIILDAGHTEC